MFSIFKKKENKNYTTGAMPSKPDVRNIKLSRVTNVVYNYPSKKWADTTMIPILNQKSLGSCVGHAHARNDMFQNYIETKEIKNLSPRYLYALSKKVDGYAGQGTFPEVTLKINRDKGCATEDTVINNCDLSHKEYINVVETDAVIKDAIPYKSGGYVQVNEGQVVTEDELKAAFDKYGPFPITISVGNYDTNIKRGNYGYHRVMLVGYGYNSLRISNGKVKPSGSNRHRFFFANSWGENWGVGGFGYFDFSKQDVIDCFIQMDIPNEIIKEAKLGPKVVITREASSAKETLGTLVATYGDKKFTCKTLELPDLGNKVNISSIPKGQYVCTKALYKNRYYAYYVKNVPGRTGIFIHIGNYFSDIKGCILVGKSHIDINRDGVKDVNYSTDTLKALMNFFNGQDFTLIIK